MNYDHDQATTSENLQLGFSAEPALAGDSPELVRRIIGAYRHAEQLFGGHGTSMWRDISGLSKETQAALLRGDPDVVLQILRYPARHDLLNGFDEACAAHADAHRRRDEASQRVWGRRILYKMVRLAEAIGVARTWNPENSEPLDVKLDDLLAALDVGLGFRLDFPNPYPGEYGLVTSRGVVDHRSVVAVYQAWRLATLVNREARVLEIGAGVGRTAYYARKFGIRDYTIVDLPHTCAAQANWLGRVLDPSVLVLSGEEGRGGKVRIFSPHWFLNSSEKFTVALNGDSITEMDRDAAASYFRAVAERADIFVSVNHEVNEFRACDLSGMSDVKPLRLLRFPFWVRDGYVEELYFFS